MYARSLLASVLAAAALPAVAAAEPVQDFSVKVTGGTKGGSKKHPVAHGVKISTGTRETTPGVLPPTTAKAVIYFPRGTRFNGKHFPSCSATRIRSARSVEDCSRRAMVGDGDAEAEAPGGVVQNDVTIDVANGRKGRYVNLFVQGTTPLRIQSNIVARIGKASGPYRYKLTVPIPQNLREPAPGVRVAITDFTVSVDRIRRKIDGERRGYLETYSCPKNGWKFKGIFTYANGDKKTVTDRVKCRKSH